MINIKKIKILLTPFLLIYVNAIKKNYLNQLSINTNRLIIKVTMMKLLLLSLTILIINNAYSQTALVTKSQPPKKSTKIIVMIKDTANNLLDRIAGVLYDKGYTIENKDEKVKFISTKEMEQKKWAMYYIVKARVNDTAIVFSGQIALNKGGHYFDVDYTGTKISSMREAWNELHAIAKMFGERIVFSK